LPISLWPTVGAGWAAWDAKPIPQSFTTSRARKERGFF
jgi:hypothetical protein